jgi:hypothetical protein
VYTGQRLRGALTAGRRGRCSRVDAVPPPECSDVICQAALDAARSIEASVFVLSRPATAEWRRRRARGRRRLARTPRANNRRAGRPHHCRRSPGDKARRRSVAIVLSLIRPSRRPIIIVPASARSGLGAKFSPVAPLRPPSTFLVDSSDRTYYFVRVAPISA